MNHVPYTNRVPDAGRTREGAVYTECVPRDLRERESRGVFVLDCVVIAYVSCKNGPNTTSFPRDVAGGTREAFFPYAQPIAAQTGSVQQRVVEKAAASGGGGAAADRGRAARSTHSHSASSSDQSVEAPQGQAIGQRMSELQAFTLFRNFHRPTARHRMDRP